ncbi:MAG TPA: DUF6065 family protein [Acetobacteraceae bacterium]|nr:DUF6065 family protein [Acetobacteraceae bacterium]
MTTEARADAPLVRFYRIIEQTRLPQRADRSAAGTLPMRAARYCDAVTTASGLGWYVFAPMDLSLLWDGTDIYWTYAGQSDWLPLEAAQFPHLRQHFDAVAPEAVRGASPPFLTALPEPGAVQIWSGLIARTAPDWSLLIRPVANLPLPGGFVPYEGLVETDRWFGPLFTNIRLTRTHAPVRLRADLPLVQAQPVPRIAYADETLNSMAVVARPEDMQEADWNDYFETVVKPNDDPARPVGSYAIAARRRRKSGCPYAAARG